MLSPTQVRRLRSGFTLIELLTVIAIIGILAAILIPTISKVRATARNTKCTAQLREWGRIIMLYANDNKGNYAVAHWGAIDANGAYYNYFSKSAVTSKVLRLCPANPNVDADLAADTKDSLKPTYGMVLGSINGNIATVAPDSGKVPLGRARSPSQYLLMMDSAPNDNVPIRGDRLTELDTYIKPLTDNSLTYSNRHGGRMINAVFGDGSVKRITYAATRPGDPIAIQTMRTTWFQLF